MKRTIILTYPRILFEANYPCSWIPFSVLAIASSLPKDTYNIVIFDENRKSAEDFHKLLSSVDSPICIGFSIMTGGGQIHNALKLAEIAKALHPNTVTVFGGPHVNVLPVETLKHPLVDYVLTGPGQSSFPLFVEALCNNLKYECVPGLIGCQNGEWIYGKSNELNQSTLVPYDFQFINVADYVQYDSTISERTINYISTQGCAYKCRFCYETNYKRKYGKLPYEQVISDIEMLVNDYAVDGIKFYDADWFIDARRSELLIDALFQLDVSWAASIHPRDILRAIEKRQPLLEKLANSRCRRLLMGIESGNDRVLKDVVDKGVSKSEMLFVAQEISRYGILGSYTFIVGFPGESYEEQEETFEFIKRLWKLTPRPETRVHIYTPYPGTKLYEDAVSLGFIPPKELRGWSDFDYYKALTPWTDKSLEKRVAEFTSMIPKM